MLPATSDSYGVVMVVVVMMMVVMMMVMVVLGCGDDLVMVAGRG